MRRIYILLGMVLGGLIVWSLGHEARRVYRDRLEYDEAMEPYRKQRRLKWAEYKAVTGIDLNDPDYWEKEFAALEERRRKRGADNDVW